MGVPKTTKKKKAADQPSYLVIYLIGGIILVFAALLLSVKCAGRCQARREPIVEFGLGLSMDEIISEYGRPNWLGHTTAAMITPDFEIPTHQHALMSYEAYHAGVREPGRRLAFLHEDLVRDDPVFSLLIYNYRTRESRAAAEDAQARPGYRPTGTEIVELLFIIGPGPEGRRRCYWVFMQNAYREERIGYNIIDDDSMPLTIFGVGLGTKSSQVTQLNDYAYNFHEHFFCSSNCKLLYLKPVKRGSDFNAQITYHISDARPVVDRIHMAWPHGYVWLLHKWLPDNRPARRR